MKKTTPVKFFLLLNMTRRIESLSPKSILPIVTIDGASVITIDQYSLGDNNNNDKRCKLCVSKCVRGFTSTNCAKGNRAGAVISVINTKHIEHQNSCKVARMRKGFPKASSHGVSYFVCFNRLQKLIVSRYQYIINKIFDTLADRAE